MTHTAGGVQELLITDMLYKIMSAYNIVDTAHRVPKDSREYSPDRYEVEAVRFWVFMHENAMLHTCFDRIVARECIRRSFYPSVIVSGKVSEQDIEKILFELEGFIFTAPYKETMLHTRPVYPSVYF